MNKKVKTTHAAIVHRVLTRIDRVAGELYRQGRTEEACAMWRICGALQFLNFGHSDFNLLEAVAQ